VDITPSVLGLGTSWRRVVSFTPRPSDPGEKSPRAYLIGDRVGPRAILEPPTNRLKRAEVHEVINSLNLKTPSGYDLINGKILQELCIIGMKYLTQLFNAVLLEGYFPAQWKFAQIILILKPGKPPNELKS
jgi:hypothetical protein